jgi:hypothetical protein
MPVAFDDLPDEDLASGGLAFDDLPDERPKRRVVDMTANPNRPLADDEVPDYSGTFKRDVPLLERAMRGYAIGGERFNQLANFLGGGAGAALEAIPGVQSVLESVTGNRTAITDTAFAGVDAAERQLQLLQPQASENRSLAGNVVEAGAAAVPDLAAAILTGGESLGAQTAIAPVRTTARAAIQRELEQAAATSARASVLPGATRGVELGQDVIAAGGTPLEAGIAGTQGAAATALTNIIPASASGNALVRAGQGAVANPVADAIQTQLENAALPDRLGLDQETTPEDLIVSALIGGPLAVGLGERGPDRINDPVAMREFAPPPAPAEPAANPLASAIAAAMSGQAVDPAGLATAAPPAPAVAPVAPPAAPAPRSATEAAAIIDRRLEALREAAAGANEDRVRELRAEQDELEALVREQDQLDAASVMRGADTRLAPDERARADQRRLEVRAELERLRGARDAAGELAKLERTLARSPDDADLVRVADSIEPARSPQSTPAQPAPAPPRSDERVEAENQERPEPQGTEATQEPAPAAAVPAAPSALTPRRPKAARPIEPGTTREQLVEEWRAARTPDEKAQAAARIAEFSAAESGGEPSPASRAQPRAGVSRRGDADAEVRAALGPAAEGVTIVASKADLPADVASRYGLNERTNDNVEGFYDPNTGIAYVIESDLDTSSMTPERRKVWVAAHERAGHAGLRGMFAEESGGAAEMQRMLARAEQNDTIAAFAEEMRRQRPGDARFAVEEALSELAAAARTGDYDHLRERYGIEIPQAQRATLRGYIDRLVQAIRRAFGWDKADVPDAEIYRLIEDANRYVRANPQARGTSAAARRAPASRARDDEFDLELDDDFGGFENNASGESAASLEAIGRIREERDLGRVRMLIDRDGTVRPIVGVDAVDTFARPGQIIVQRNLGGDEWTAISTDPAMSRDLVAGKINAARSKLADALEDEDVIASRGRSMRIADLPRDMREDLFNNYAMFTDPDARQRAFEMKRLPGGMLRLDGVKVARIPDSQLEDYIAAGADNLPPVLIADNRLIDGQHRIAAARKQGVTELPYLDATGVHDTEEAGYISDLPDGATGERPIASRRRKGEGDDGQADQPEGRRGARRAADRQPGARGQDRAPGGADDRPVDQTETPAFRRWFGESKVVDDDGNPLQVYHGTAFDFDTFEGYEIVGWFSEDPELTQRHAESHEPDVDEDDPEFSTTGAMRSVPAYLSVQKPVEIEGVDMNDALDVDAVSAALSGAGVEITPELEKHLRANEGEPVWFAINRAEFEGAVAKQGFDGIHVNEDGVATWGVFKANQIKSSIANNGEFDPDSDSIIASRRRSEDDSAIDTSPGGPRDFKVGNTTIEYGIGRDGTAEVILVRTPPANRRQGSAREAMRQFLEQTDAAGLEVRLTASPMGKGGAGKAALERFYRDLGFKPNKGRARDFATRHTLIRKPQAGEPIASRRTPAQARAERQQRLGVLANAGMPQGTPVQATPGGRFEGLRESVDRLRGKLQDSMLPVRRAQERAAAAKGGLVNKPGVSTWSLDDTLNAYRLENLMHGRAKDRAETADLELIKPMQNALRRTGRTLEQLSDYVYALHAPERNAQVAKVNKAMPDAGSGITTKMAQDILAGTEPGPYSGKKLTPEDIRILEGIYQRNIVPMRDRTLDYMVEGQQIPPALAQQLRQVYPNYVPMRGKESEFEGFAGGTGKGLSGKRSPIKRALGRGVDNIPVNVIGELVGDLQRSIVAAEKARVNQAFLKFALENPMDDLFKVEPVDLEWKYSDATGEAYLGVRSRGEDVDRVMTVMHNGEPVNIRFEDPELRDAVLNMGAEDFRTFTKIVGVVNRWRSAVLTRFNPAFPAVNILRDLNFGLSAIAAEKGVGSAFKSAGTYPAALRALWRDQAQRRGDSSVPNARKSWDDWAREYAEGGAKTGLTVVDDPADLQRRLSDASVGLMRLAAQGRPWSLAKESVVRTVKPIAETIERVNDATENALRLAIYRDQRLKGESQEKAAEYAKNVTINFNRKGTLGPALNALYLFYNASVQGTHAVQRVLRRPGVQAYLAGLLGLQAMLAQQMMEEDEDLDGVTAWDTVPDYVKRTSLVIPLGSMTGNQRDYFALPMPYGFNLAPYLGGRGMQHYRFGKRPTDSSLASDMAKSATEAFSPLPLGEGYGAMFGDTLGFAMQLASNRDDLGRQIATENPYADYAEPRALTGRVDTPRVYQSAAQLLAKAGGGDLDERIAPVGYLDVAPEQIEATVGYALGGIGNLGNKSQRWWEQLDAGNFEGTMDMVSQAPIASRLVGRGSPERTIAERYYGERGELARKLDVLQDRIARGEDPDQVLASAAERDPTLGGLSAARRKRPGKNGGEAGDVKRTAGGGAQVDTEEGYTPSVLKSTEKAVKAVNKAIKSVRNPDATNAEVVAALEGLAEERIETVLGLPDDYDGEAKAPNRVRQRALKALQKIRAREQQRLLKSVQLERRVRQGRDQAREGGR